MSQLRTKVKAKVKKNLEEAEKAGGREANKKNVVQKVKTFYAQETVANVPGRVRRAGGSGGSGNGALQASQRKDECPYGRWYPRSRKDYNVH